MSTPELGGQIPFFLELFLGKPASALPKGAQWVLEFEGSFSPQSAKRDYNDILPVPAIKKVARGFEPQVWDIDGAIDITLEKDYQSTKGCMFAQAVNLPGESNQVNPEGFQQNGFIRTFTGAGRDPFANLQISFLDTNLSFVDNVIRPWVIATAHLGLIAREGEDNYRCNLSVYKLGVISTDKTPFVLQKYTFFGLCPVSVTGEEYNYTQTQSPVNREASFIYHYYTIDSRVGSDSVRTIPPLPLSTKTKGVNILANANGRR
jgi:hypothetical protein